MPEPLFNPVMISALVALLAVAALTDLHDRRIPNPLVVIGLAVGLAGHAWLSGTAGLAVAGSGALVGLVCLLPFHISGGMGAGDVKLMAMCGAFLGPFPVAVATFASLAIGGALGLGWLFWQLGFGGRHRTADDENAGPVSTIATGPVSNSTPIPYALAIVAGVLVALKAAPYVLSGL